MDKKILFRVGGVVILAIALFFGYSEFRYLQRHETTDDAQIDGDVNPVIPKAGGYVKEIRFKDNQFVKEGDTLIVLDDADYRIRVDQAEAALQSAMAAVGVSRSQVNVASATVQSSQASVQTARDQVATAQANVAAAQARARKANQDFDRYSRLLAEKTVPQQQFDVAQAERDAAQAQLLAAQAQLQTAQSQVNAAGTQTSVTSSQRRATQGQITVAQSTIKQRQADLDMAKLQLSYTIVRAPASGVVSKRSVQIGQLVQAGQAVCSVVGNTNLWVTANFKETQLHQMVPGQTVDIDVDAFGGEKLTGQVGSFAGATGAKFSLLPPDNATGNYVKVVQRIPVRIELDKKSPLYAKLRPGMSATVAVDLQK
ncbi:HlyD family secretion protein [Spirosoma endbachense]|jgi:membrane fusion protein (multidrug efflux system)|uniref:HlyD family efflux transporter periplasmic adaptor subunit n=1 Tax=Spirosoma endbachense TaxID=2666025 RepID=A0A6P1W3B3_9BACT|nr:HlyD family secretion protein [Spirosoma endbachense]QHV99913.1 HlyD family efflux transporter periplasmic adaptor subunit [Spirosoma endbachense]